MDVAFTIVSDAAWATGTVTVFEPVGARGDPDGGVARAAAVLTMAPASRSDCVTVCVPVQFVDTPGARVELGHEMPAAFGSETLTAVSVTLPVLVSRKM